VTIRLSVAGIADIFREALQKVANAISSPLQFRLPRLSTACVILLLCLAIQIQAQVFSVVVVQGVKNSRAAKSEAVPLRQRGGTDGPDAVPHTLPVTAIVNQSVIHLVTSVYKVAALTIIWACLGCLIRFGQPPIVEVFAAIAVAGVAPAVGAVARAGFVGFAGVDPGPFNLRGLAPAGTDAQHLLSHLDMTSVWWSVLAGAGFAQAWHRNRALAISITLGATLAWTVIMSHH